MKRYFLRIACLGAALAGLAGAQQEKAKAAPRALGVEDGWGVFQTKCMTCHGNPNVDRAPSPAAIREMSPEKIYDALTQGPMKTQGQGLSEDEKRMVVWYMSGRPLGSSIRGDAKDMPNHCASNPPMADPSSGPAWNGWGADLANTRFQPAKIAGLSPDQVPQLKLKWAFGYPGSVSAFAQPTVVSGRIFVGTDIGYIYSIDAKSGCVYWSYQTKGQVRSAISVGPVKGKGPAKYGLFFGDAHANVYGLDAQTGQQLWIHHADDHFIARITAAPTLYNGRVYVPVSSSEEWQAGNPDYPCCTSRGSVVALDASNGERFWKTYVVAEDPKPTKKNSKGVQLYGPAGASVWNSPTIDVQRKAIYFGTGDSETYPAAKTSDAVMALDLVTGKVKWFYQAQENDSFLGGCNGPNKSENCPEVQGPDLDIGNSPILKSIGGGKRVVIAATKDGNVIALDPDKNGAVVWKTSVSQGRFSGIVWGGAADDKNVYYGLSSGGMVAVSLAKGEKVWFTPLAKEGTRVNNSAATTLIPGVAFVGGNDGKLHALSTADGKILWEYETAHAYDTVNKVTGKGGAISAPGPTVVGGMLYVGSGYGVTAGLTGNVLLAFGVQ